MAFSKKELLDRLVAFKQKNGRYPTHTDFRHGNITPSKNVYYRNFEKMENAIEEAKHYENGDLIFEEKKGGETKILKTTKGTFQCPFCGSWKSGIDEYCSSLTTIISMRFVDLLPPTEKECCFNQILDCIYAVFGVNNPIVKQKLQMAGYLRKFDERFCKDVQDAKYKLRCHVCGKLKDVWDVTVDTSKKPNCGYICEDCL
jgi:hypothetical protein